jgi:hypothetical protein
VRISGTFGSIGRHAAGALVEASLVVAVVIALIVAASVHAGRAPGADSALAAPSSSAVWVTTGSATARSEAAAEVAFGTPFSVGYSTRDRKPWALVLCYPNDTTVYVTTFKDGDGHEGYVWGEYFSVYEGGPVPQDFVLGDGYANWSGGGADCTVELLKFSADGQRATVLARSAFTGVP